MTAADFDLARVLQPIGTEAFFSRHWEREPLLIRRNDPGFYQHLVTLEAIESFISQADARYPAIRLAKGGRFYAPEVYTHDLKYGDEIFRGVPDLEFILSEYSQGATLTLPAWHRAWPPLARLCAGLESELDHVVNANVYLTPPGAQGFTPHYDTHEVLVLQVAGSKHWRVYSPLAALPHRTQPFAFDTCTPPARPLLECELSAGDLLYLPRGHVHTTTTGDQLSAHVTIGITVYTWIELLAEACQSAVDLPELRAALPPGFAHREHARAALARRLPMLLQQLGRSIDADAVAERLAQRVRGARPRAPVEFRADPRGIDPHTPLRVAGAITWSVNHDQGGLLLMLNGRRIRLQPAVEPILSAMCGTPVFTPESLPAHISLNARLQLARYLLGVGFLCAAGPDPAAA